MADYISSYTGPQIDALLGKADNLAISSPSNGQVLKYNDTTQKFENADIGANGYVCTFSFDSSYTNLSCDKAISDIQEAFSNGSNIIGVLVTDNSDEYTVFQLVGMGEDMVAFSSGMMGDIVSFIGVVENDSDVWSYDATSFPPTVSGTNDGTNWTSLTIGDTTKAIPSGGGGGGLTNYNFTHTANQSVSGSVTVTYAANTRGSRMVSASADLAVTFAVENLSDNYLWIKNTGSSDIDITINDVTQNSSSVSNIYIPDDGITISAGKVCEIGIVVNADGAFITSRSDLSL